MYTLYAIFIFYFFAALAYGFSIKHREIRPLLYCAFLSIFFILVAFQDNYGTDYELFRDIFLGKIELFPIYKGIIMYFLIKFLSSLTTNYVLFFTIWAAVQTIALNCMIKTYEKFYCFDDRLQIFTYILFTLSFFAMSFNAFRSIIATTLIPIVFILYYEREILKSFAFTAAGALFHPTIVIIIPLFLIFDLFKKHYKVTLMIFAFMLFFVFNRIGIIQIIAEFIYNHAPANIYTDYLASYHMKPYSESIFSYLGIYFILFTNILSIMFYKKETDEKSVFLYNLAYFAALLRILFYGIPILGRVYLLFSVFEFFIPYVLFKNLNTKKAFYLGYLILIAFFITVIKYLLFNNRVSF
nr:EpsG family protein [uncultured Campylobacter sp.]